MLVCVAWCNRTHAMATTLRTSQLTLRADRTGDSVR